MPSGGYPVLFVFLFQFKKGRIWQKQAIGKQICQPSVAQLQMRRKLVGNQEISGTIRLANYLSETSARFSIAHELGHYVLREHSPIGLNYMLAA